MEQHAAAVGDEQLQNVEWAAERLNVPPSWIYSHAKALGAVKVGKYLRFRPSRVERYLDQHQHTDHHVDE